MIPQIADKQRPAALLGAIAPALDLDRIPGAALACGQDQVGADLDRIGEAEVGVDWPERGRSRSAEEFFGKVVQSRRILTEADKGDLVGWGRHGLEAKP